MNVDALFPAPAPEPCTHPGPYLHPTFEDGVRTGLRCSACGEFFARPTPPVIADPENTDTWDEHLRDDS